MRQTQEALRWLAVFAVVFMGLAGSSQAATQLDKTFGENGFVVKDFGHGDDEIFAVAPQADGNIIVAGYYNNGAVKNLVVARYLPTGELDKTFNNDGMFQHSMGSGDTVARSLAIQSDGMIVVAGAADNGGDNIAVLRLTKDGFLDNTFADNGQLLLPVADGEANSYATKITATGAILVAGTIVKDGDAGTYGFVVKLTGSGQLDIDFGAAGMSLIQFDYDAEIRALALLTDGKILAAGAFAANGTPDAGLLRLNQNGTVDATFGEMGQVLLSLPGTGSRVNDIKLDAGGHFLLVGDADNGTNLETFASRLNEDGSLDMTFAASGVYFSTLTSGNVGQAVSVQADGTIVIAGYATTTKGKDVYVLTLEEAVTSSAEAKISATYLLVDRAETDDVGNALTVLPDGFVFVAGATGASGGAADESGKKNFALLRFVGGVTLNSLTGGVEIGEGVSTAGYTVVTKQVTGITRVGAVSGGIITDFGSSPCIDSCNAACSSSTSATCFSSCFSVCELPTVTLRGVVYGTKENPIFEENGNQDSSEDTTSSTTDTTISTTSATTSSTNDDSIFPQTGSWVYDIVRSGQTEDGSGTGSYDSEILEITPNTLYHLRAYAVLSDGTVIYGNEVTFKTDDACFIATAAFGSMLDRHVAILREFRDRIMMPNALGQRLVGAYYNISPPIADLVKEYDLLQTVVRVLLVPFVLLAYFILKTGLVTKACLLVAGIGGFAVISRKTHKSQVTPV